MSPSETKTDGPSVLYSKSKSVNVTKEKDPTSEVIQVLSRGEAVKVIERSGMRYRVKFSKGKTGWVSKRQLSEHQPSETPKGLSDLGKLKSKVPPKVIESRSGGSIRG